MFFSSWCELDVDAGLCKVYIPLIESKLSLELDKGYLTVREGAKSPFTFRLSPDSETMEVISAQNLSTLTVLTLKFATLAPLLLSEKWPEKFMEFPLLCRSCGSDSVPAGRKAFLVPSLLWGFEEVRACEECAPMSHGKVRRTDHSQRIYVSDQKIYATGVCSACPGCRTILGREVVPLTAFLSDLKVEGLWVEIRKFSVFSDHLPFLQGYSRLAELGGAVDKISERNFRLVSDGLEISMRVLGGPVEIRPREGERMPEEISTRTVRCIRVLVNISGGNEAESFPVDHDQLLALVEAVEKFPVSPDLWPSGGDWKLLYLPLHPEMDD